MIEVFSFSPSAIAIAPQSSIEFPVVKNENKLDKKGRKESYIFCVHMPPMLRLVRVLLFFIPSAMILAPSLPSLLLIKKKKICERERERERERTIKRESLFVVVSYPKGRGL